MIKILLVEDLDIVREDLKNLIDWESEGYQIIGEARNGEIGLSMFRELRPDIVITDIRMPVLSGLEMIRAIQRETDEGEVGSILLTAYKEFEYAKKAIDLGLDSYIIKYEITKEQLLQELARQYKLLQGIRETKNISNASLIKEFLSNHAVDPAALRDILPADGEIKMLLARTISCIRGISGGFYSAAADGIFESLKGGELSGCDYFTVILQSDEFIVLYRAPRSRGATRNQRDQSMIARAFLKAFKKHQMPLFLVECGRFVDYENVRDVFSAMQEASRTRAFSKDSTVIDISGNGSGKDRFTREQEAEAAKEVNEIRRAFAGENFAELPDKIDHLLKSTLKEIGSYALFNRVARDLAYLIGNCGRNRNQDALRAVSDNVLSNPQLYNVYELSEVLGKLVADLKGNETSRYSRKVREVISYMEEHYGEDVNLSVMADQLHLSTIYICQIFKREVGVTFKEYLTKIRMREAVRLLESGRYKVYEVSGMVGYQTVQYFSRVFKRETGKYPSDYT